jgi:hypothetical protein
MQNNTTKMCCHTGTHNKEKNKAGGVKKGAGMEETSKAWVQLGQLFNESNPLSFVKTHEQSGITYIPDIF